MTNKEYLSKYQTIWREIDEKLDEIAVLRSKAEKVTAALSDMPKGESSGDFTTAADKLIELQLQVYSEVLEAIDKRNEVESVINAVENSRHRCLLRKIYINGAKLANIALEENYNYHYLCTVHGEALKEIRQRP